MSRDLLLMLLSDARLPVAGHTQSGGLEPAVRDGLTAAHVPAYLRTRLRTVTRVEAAAAVVARHHLEAGRPVEPVEQAWAARTPSAAMRRTSRAQARAFLRLAERLWPDSEPVRAVAAAAGPSRALALAAAAVACELDATALARLVGYDDVQTVTAAALKLLPLDPADATGWVLGALPEVDRLAAEVAPLTTPEAVPAAGAPQIEVWAEAHAVSSRRLFSA
ncbi:urease accessory protein UreF [Nocardioides dongkuii]|uniref:urease accessory protein UreF n=1 Tax=Nocardioides dongkuii TaxID=2760089 RepID=UPI0029D412A2|nr:urease accessory UreF family protein [Nocardioides dongkuii]